MTPSPSASRPCWRWIAVPAALTLLVTAVRFLGELLALPPPLFARVPGGGGALIGIGWLIPLFGVLFALRLARHGGAPARPVSATMTMLCGVGCVAAAFAVAQLAMDTTPWAMAVGACGSLLGGLFAFHAWRELGGLLLRYAVAARLPVVALAFADVSFELGTHYGKLAEGAPDYAPLPRALVLALAQAVFWVPLTVLGGGLCGLLAVGLSRRARSTATARVSASRS